MLVGVEELLLGSAKSYLAPRKYLLGFARTRTGLRVIPPGISADLNGVLAIPFFLSEIPTAICCDRHFRARISSGRGPSRLAILQRNESKRGKPLASGEIYSTRCLRATLFVSVLLVICTFRSCVWLCTGRTTHLVSVFFCGIRNLLWASGGNSSRNATCFGCVCVDRFGSWCFLLWQAVSGLSSEPWLNTMERPGVNSNRH